MSHWYHHNKHWNKITPPIRPHESTVDNFVNIVGNKNTNVMILGVTQELAQSFGKVTAVDKEPAMIKNIWIGDSEYRKAVLADWRIWENTEKFSAILGDGSINMVSFSTIATQLMTRCLDWLEPGGVFAARVFTRPNQDITQDQLKADIKNYHWHAYRCRMNQYNSVKYGVNIQSQKMLESFNNLFPDRSALCATTGWDIDDVNRSMDAYKNSLTMTSYPTRSEILTAVPKAAVNVRFVEETGYQLAENFPILVFNRAD